MSSNQKIIIEEGIKNGIFTEEEVDLMLIQGRDIPLHSASYWKDLGKFPVKGSKGIPVQLWRLSKDTTDDSKDKFILVKSYLFSEDQVEDIEEEEGL